MKILLITQDLEKKSGWGTFSCNTTKGLSEKGHAITVLVHKKSQEPYSQISGLPPALKMMESSIARLKTAFLIRKSIKKYQPDIIHILVEPYALAMPIVNIFTKLPPWIMNFHGTYSVQPFLKPKTKKLMFKVMEQVSQCVSCSKFTLQKVLKASLKYFDEDMTKKIKDKTQLFRFGIEKQSQLPRVKSETKSIVFVGGVKDRKGVQELIDGFAAYKKMSDTPVHLHLIGDAPKNKPYIKDIMEFIQKNNLQKTITLHGMISEEQLDTAYQNANVFIMLSKSTDENFEGFGLVFLEANSRGIPTIGSRDSGCKEAIDEGVSGYSVNSTNTDEVARRLQWILDDNKIAPENCCTWAKKYNIAQQTETFERIYKECIAANSQ